MPYDPRPEIQALFTDAQIAASDGNTNNYVEISIAERNPERMGKYKGAGLIILEQPIQGEPILYNIGGDLHKTPLAIQASLYVQYKDSLENPDVFIKNVINTFQTTIRTNRRSLVSNGDVEGFGAVNPLKTESDDILGRAMMIYCFKFE